MYGDPEDQETTLSYYVEQDDLEEVKDWFETNRESRNEEAARLEVALEEAQAQLQEFEEKLEVHREREANLMFHNRDLTPNPNDVEIERYHRLLRENVWNIRRQLRDLVRWDRDDLEWIWKLERQQREAANSYRPVTKKQQRSANWKEKKAKQ